MLSSLASRPIQTLLSAFLLALSAGTASSATVTRVFDMSFGLTGAPVYYGSMTVRMDSTADTGGSFIVADGRLSILDLDLFVSTGGGNYSQIVSDPSALGDVRFRASGGRLLILRLGTAASLGRAGDFRVEMRVPGLNNGTDNLLDGDVATGGSSVFQTCNGTSMLYFPNANRGAEFCPPADGIKVSELSVLPPTTQIPLPAGGVLMLSGLAGLAALGRLRARGRRSA